MSLDNNKRLMYQPFSSILNPGFWQHLKQIKLDKLKLSQEPIDIHGSYSCGLATNLPCLASFDHASLQPYADNNATQSCPLYGQLVCTNIKQDFLSYDKKKFIDDIGEQIWQSILNGDALKNPEKYLSKFGLLVYGDLKKYKFVYFFAFPALNYPIEVHFDNLNSSEGDTKDENLITFKPILDTISENLLQKLQDEYDKPMSERLFQRGYFIVKHFTDPTSNEIIALLPLTHYHECQDDSLKSTIYFAYNDPSGNEEYPGWPLRNFLCLIAIQFQLEHIKLIRIRSGPASSRSKIRLHHSQIFHVSCKLDPNYKQVDQLVEFPKMPHVTGWERNEHQQLAPKQVDLSALLDPKRLADDAVNLNLRLMKWRLVPSLDLDKIASTKCLLLGCGALGSHIARGLLAWGIKSLTLVDNAKISYSNPVRQTLYTFEDCSKANGVFKAQAAAANLKKIHPNVNVESYTFSIPMPGHRVTDNEIEQTKKDIATLESLIDDCDVIFLLMDTRESRWLPTVICLAKRKLVINAAIGFDTFLLQRHGIRNYQSVSPQISPMEGSTSSGYQRNAKKPEDRLPSDQLGCYFCNDIVAPGDSTIDRTLDQQCTVSRPGVSMLVSALAVELLASILSSPMGPQTPAPQNVQNDFSQIDDEDCDSELGLVPHSVRGNISRYHIYLPTSPCFNKCSACSVAVVQSYIQTGFEFLLRVFNDPSYLEEVAGLKDLQNFNESVWTLDSDDYEEEE